MSKRGKNDENSVRIAITARLDAADPEERYIAEKLRKGCPISDDGIAKLKGSDLLRYALLVVAKKYDPDFEKSMRAEPTSVSEGETSIEQPKTTKPGASAKEPKKTSLYGNVSSFVLEKK
jgi:hypothetical protein